MCVSKVARKNFEVTVFVDERLKNIPALCESLVTQHNLCNVNSDHAASLLRRASCLNCRIGRPSSYKSGH